MTAVESLPSETSVPSEAGPVPKAQPAVRDETWSDEKDEVGSETEEKEEPPSDTQTPSTRVDREAFPATFDDLCRQMTERAKFLLEVMCSFDYPCCQCFALRRPSGLPCHQISRFPSRLRHAKPPYPEFVLFLFVPFSQQLAPSTVQSPSATAEGTSALMHHLAEELSDLPTPPPARLQSRLLRWRSEDHGKNRWKGAKGVVDVLRVQSQVRRRQLRSPGNSFIISCPMTSCTRARTYKHERFVDTRRKR